MSHFRHKMFPTAGPAISKRVPREIQDAQSEAMRKNGIYYWADEADIRRGKALIIGPADTPYAHCPLLFSFQLPTDYPFSPPAVQILTSDGQTRFHPNLYVAGKVCLSILGTWSGPKWSAVMTISTILSSIQSLLEANPIVNEPSFEKYTLENEDARKYAEFVQMRLAEESVAGLVRWKEGSCPPAWEEFRDILDEIGDGLLEELANLVVKKAAEGEKEYTGLVYNMSGRSHWATLAAKIAKVRRA